jgi:GT2 family glycosyltransferase
VVIQPDWLDRLAMLVSQPNVATVGPLLLYPDGTIQHAGVVLGFGGFADHLYMGEPLINRPEEITVSPLHRRDVMANTGACLAIKRDIYRQLGGLNERLMVAGDLDLCLRARQLGLRNLYDPAVRLIHKESKSRQKGLPVGDREILTAIISKCGFSEDPYFNANLSLSCLSPMPTLGKVNSI